MKERELAERAARRHAELRAQDAQGKWKLGRQMTQGALKVVRADMERSSSVDASLEPEMGSHAVYPTRSHRGTSLFRQSKPVCT